MPLQDTLDNADAEFQAALPSIQDLQNAYFSDEGRYWQGLVTHSKPNVPIGGASKTADLFDQAPTDQPVTWNDLQSLYGITIPDTWQQALRIDSYRSANGDGYQIVRRLIFDGSVYERINNFGPEKRGQQWEKRSDTFQEESAPPWETGVSYEIDDLTEYDGTTYICIQAHTSQAGWEPPNVPALWNVKQSGSEWQAGVSYQSGQPVLYNSTEYRCIQGHTSQEGWEPPNVPALWNEVS